MGKLENALIDLALYGTIEAMKDLISKGANVNEQDTDGGTTALIQATAIGNIEKAKLLVAHGADVEGKDRDGWSPMMTAADLGISDMIKFLLDRGANINAVHKNGETPLMRAAKNETPHHLETIALLLRNGADPKAKDDHGRTALDIARLNDCTAIETLLNSKG